MRWVCEPCSIRVHSCSALVLTRARALAEFPVAPSYGSLCKALLQALGPAQPSQTPNPQGRLSPTASLGAQGPPPRSMETKELAWGRGAVGSHPSSASPTPYKMVNIARV